MCRNGRYTECGIKQRHGFARERWRIESDFAVRLDPALGDNGVLLEPTSVVAKAWEHIEHIGRRARWQPRTVLVTGAGPIGLLAALLGVQRGLDVHVLDRVTDGPKPDLVRRLGATYHTGPADDARPHARHRARVHRRRPGHRRTSSTWSGPGGIVCLTGVSSGGRPLTVDIGQANRDIVLENNVVFGSVNANLRHWQAAAAGAGRRRPGLAVRADHPPGAAGRVRRRAERRAGRRQGGRWTLRCDDAPRGPAPGPARAAGVPRRHRRRHRC